METVQQSLESLGFWGDATYQQTTVTVLLFLFVSGAIVFALRKSNHYFVVSWASIKSWLIVAPLLFLALGAPDPWPLIVLTLIAVLGAKVFFQLMGMYHRSYFVMTCYFGILALGYSVHINSIELYNLLPMIVLGMSCLVPLVRNNYKRMIQYISLTSLAFVFLGWSFMHLGLIMKFEKGLYQLMYLIILTEFCDNTNLAISRYVGKIKLFEGIDTRRSIESTVLAAGITIAVAFLMTPTAGWIKQILAYLWIGRQRRRVYWRYGHDSCSQGRGHPRDGSFYFRSR